MMIEKVGIITESSIYSLVASLFFSNAQLRQYFGWETIDFAAYPSVALIITFFVAIGFRNRFLPRTFAVLVVAAMGFVALRGAAFNENHWDLLNCDILPAGTTKIATRPALAYRLAQCKGGHISAVDFEKEWSSIGHYEAVVLRSDDAIGGYLRESGQWELAARSTSRKTFLRGFGDSELIFEAYRIKVKG